MSLYNIQLTNPEQFRKQICNKLNEKIHNEKRSYNLEVSIYNYCIQQAIHHNILRKWTNKCFLTLYINRLRSIINNLTPYIIDLIEHRVITTRQLGSLSFYEMNPIKWSALIDAKKARDKNIFENTTQKVSSLFVCRKCRGRNCINTPVQTRSCDEGITNFISCNDCGNNWKMSS